MIFPPKSVIKMFQGVTVNIFWKGSIGSRVTCRCTLLGCEYTYRQQEFARTPLGIFLLPGKKLFHCPAVWKTFLTEFWRRSWQVFFAQMEGCLQSRVWDSWGSLSAQASNLCVCQKRKNIKECLTEGTEGRELSTALQANVFDKE